MKHNIKPFTSESSYLSLQCSVATDIFNFMCDCTDYKFNISIFWEFKSSRMLHCAVRVKISISKDCSAIIFRFSLRKNMSMQEDLGILHEWNICEWWPMCTRQGHSIPSDNQETGGWEGGRQVRKHQCCEKMTFLCQWGYGKKMESHGITLLQISQILQILFFQLSWIQWFHELAQYTVHLLLHINLPFKSQPIL